MFRIIEKDFFIEQVNNKKFDKKIYKKITDFVYPILREKPTVMTKNLKALTRNLEGRYRYRIGNYRLLYRVDENDLTVAILSIQHRKDAYKNKR